MAACPAPCAGRCPAVRPRASAARPACGSPACPSREAARRERAEIRNCRGSRRGFPGLSSSAPCCAVPSAARGGRASR